MKITAVESILLAVPYRTRGGLQSIAGRPAAGLNMLLVRIETDRGITGWGEAFGHAVAPGTRTVLDTLVGPMLIGRDARRHRGADGRPAAHAASARAQRAGDLCALRGRHRAVGHRRQGRRASRSTGCSAGRSAARSRPMRACCAAPAPRPWRRAAARASRKASARSSCTRSRCRPCRRRARRSGRTSRLMLDTNCPWSRDEALAMVEALRPFDLHWLEEPLWPPEDYAGLAQAARGRRDDRGGRERRASPTSVRCSSSARSTWRSRASPRSAASARCAASSRWRTNSACDVVPHCRYLGAGFLASLHIDGVDAATRRWSGSPSIWRRARSATGSSSRTGLRVSAGAGPRPRSRSGADRALSHPRAQCHSMRGPQCPPCWKPRMRSAN